MSALEELVVMEPASTYSGGQRRLRILCVDDNVLVGEMLLRLLRVVGHEPHLATDGEEAWERLFADFAAFELVITDHHMPRCDGLELVRRLRHAEFPGKIIVHSNSLRRADVEAYEVLGVNAIVAKASPSADILRAITAVCDRG